MKPLLEKKLFFISGLPRSGSTLLSAILRQNPIVEAGMTSPVGSITAQVRASMVQTHEIDALIQSDDIRRNILRGIFEGYYSECDRPIIFDTNRSWCGRIPELKALFGDVKIVAMVRNPAWIVDSIERITRKTPLRPSGMIRAGSNIDARAMGMMRTDGLVGAPLGALREAIYGPDASNILLVEYEALCSEPAKTLEALYGFIDEPLFDHDFERVSYEQEHFDTALRTPGLHTVSGRVELKPRQTLLPPGVFNNLSSSQFWAGDLESKASRIVIK